MTYQKYQMEIKLRKVEDDVVEIRERVVVLEERDRRLHEDMSKLTTALEQNTAAISAVSKVTEKRGAFVAGAVFIIGAFSAAVSFVLVTLKDWLLP